MDLKKKIKEKIYQILRIQPKLMAPELIKPHIDHDGKTISYYFDSGKAQEENNYAHFNASQKIKEIQKEDGSKSILYLGLVSGAGNAVGIIETEVPLEEIAKTKQGTDILVKMLSDDYAMGKAYKAWDEEGIEYSKLSTSGYAINKPLFFVGRIKGTQTFELDENITPEVSEEILRREEDARKEQKRRNKEDLKFADIFGNTLYIGETRCYRNQTTFKTEYCGVNDEGLRYKYSTPKKISEKGDPYIYMGTLHIGRPTESNIGDNGVNTYSKIVIQLQNPIDVVFVEDSLFAHQALGKMFSERNVKKQKDFQNGPCYLGKVITDEDGVYHFEEPELHELELIKTRIPDETKKENKNKIINFREGRDA